VCERTSHEAERQGRWSRTHSHARDHCDKDDATSKRGWLGEESEPLAGAYSLRPRSRTGHYSRSLTATPGCVSSCAQDTQDVQRAVTPALVLQSRVCIDGVLLRWRRHMRRYFYVQAQARRAAYLATRVLPAVFCQMKEQPSDQFSPVWQLHCPHNSCVDSPISQRPASLVPLACT